LVEYKTYEQTAITYIQYSCSVIDYYHNDGETVNLVIARTML